MSMHEPVLSQISTTVPAAKPLPWPVVQRLAVSRLFAPVDIAVLAYFRIVFGAIMLWEVWRYFDRGWIPRYWIDPVLNFTYYGFKWVRPWPGNGMYLHFIALGILSMLIMLGWHYRISTILFFLGFTYMFLLEQARYLNHFYLICLISLLLIFVPAHRHWSVDAWRRSEWATRLAPAWTLWLLQTQLGIAYFFGGVAKLNGDWLRGEPMRMWMARRTDFPLIGHWFTEEWMVYLFSYGGLLLDLLIVPLLIWRRTRLLAFAAAVMFHLMNARLFTIGIFPWFMIAATAIFFAPDWPHRLIRRWQTPASSALNERDAGTAPTHLQPRRTVTLVLLGLYLAVQIVLPLRHFAYPGDVNWTEEGHRFAWHMKLRSKQARAEFIVTDPTRNISWYIDPHDYLPRWQERKMVTRPDMILQFSHYLAHELRDQGYEQVEVRAYVEASLNGRKYQLLIDPEVDLAAERRTLWPAPWIVPLTEPLR